MSTPPNELPPPPPMQPPQAAPPTQIVGQQSAPSTAVPVGSGLPQSASFTVAQKTNQMAIISLVTALVAPIGHCIGIGGITLIIVSLVTGHMARRQIKQTGEGGAELALIGLIISYAHLAIATIVAILYFSFIVAWLALVFHAGSH
jgi:uncharacterized protein DUF4190